VASKLVTDRTTTDNGIVNEDLVMAEVKQIRTWENSDYLIELINSSWTRPTQQETPKSALMVEDGCYW
jgi:hypothetical protein